MLGVTSDGKIIPVNKDFMLRIPYGAGYDVYDGGNENGVVLAITRFDELPANYNTSTFQPQIDPKKCDVLNFCLASDIDEESISQLNFQQFLNELKQSADAQFERAAVGSATGGDDGAAENYRALKVSQNTLDIRAGYITTDLFVSVKFSVFIFTKNHMYRAVFKVERSAQKFKRTEFFLKSLLSSVRPNTL